MSNLNNLSTKIVISGLSKSFGELKVYNNLNLHLDKNKFYIISEESGFGKTTLFRILMGLDNFDTGEISGLENTVKSVLFQEDRLIENLTLGLNIRLGIDELNSNLKEHLIEKIKLEQDKDKQNFNYNFHENLDIIQYFLDRVGLQSADKIHILQKKVSELSGGMKRRASILRCLLREADVYFLDEPLKGLDEENKELVLKLINTALRGKTVFYITHDIKEAAAFDNAVFLSLK